MLYIVSMDDVCSERGCPGMDACRDRAKIHGLRRNETCADVEERKWIAYKILRRPRALNSDETRGLDLIFALNGGSRQPISVVASDLRISRTTAVKLVRAALKKIGWSKPVKLGRDDVL